MSRVNASRNARSAPTPHVRGGSGGLAFKTPLARTPGLLRLLCCPWPSVLAGESGLLLEIFQMDSKKFQKISENIGIKGVIVSPVV